MTLLEMFEGVLEVKASSGDNQLGGKDFDQRLIDYLTEKVRIKTGQDVKNDLSAMARIRDEAEKCKKVLSEKESCQILLPMLSQQKGKVIGLDETITRALFEELTRDLMERTHAPMDVVFEDSGLSILDVDHIILVGGSTRMPMVEKDIENYLQKKPQKSLNPDFAVAEGASIQAGIISGEIEEENGLIMTDVNPYTLGVRAHDGYSFDRMAVVIPRNITIPVTREELFNTYTDYQTSARIEVFQGESEIASSNHFLGEFVISGIPSAKAQKEKICVQFSYDQNGILDVKATIVSTGKSASIQINMLEERENPKKQKSAESFDFRDIWDEMNDFPDDEEEERIDVSEWRVSPIASQFRTTLRRAEKTLKNLDPGEEEWVELEGSIYNLKEYIVLGMHMDAREEEEYLLTLLQMIE